MLDLIVKFFPWDCILWTRTMQEKKKFVPSIIWPGLQTGKNLSFLGVWLYLPVSIMSLWLLIRIFTNSFWASAVTGRIPEGCKWPLARAEISKWKKKKRERGEIQQQGLTEVCLTCGSLHSKTFFSTQIQVYSLIYIAVCRFNTNIQTTKWLVSKYMILLFK